MSESPPVSLPWRLDGVAWSALAMSLMMIAACVTHTPVTGLDHFLGPDQLVIVGSILDAVGLATPLLVFTWLVVTLLYILRRGPLRILCRASGWLILVAVLATTLDDLRAHLTPLPEISLYGPGGSLGAYLKVTRDRHLPGEMGLVATVSVGGIGLLLAANRLVLAILRGLWHTLRLALIALLRGNRMIESISHAVLRLFVPKRREAIPGEPAASEPAVLSESVATIPISTHTSIISAATPELRLVTSDEEPAGEVPINPMPAYSVSDSPEAASPPAPRSFELPPLEMLNDAEPLTVENQEAFLRERAALLEKTFLDFGLNIKVVGIHTGPVLTQYEVALETGLRLNKVTNLADDLALNLKVPSVRVVAPLPNRNTVGIEVPNEQRQIVRLKELIQSNQSKIAKFKLPIFLGKDVEGRPLTYDLASMPHLLIAGRTGTGKSVCLNAVILSLLYTRTPEECRMIMIDPKMVELSEYGKIPHLMHPVVTKPEKAEAILSWAVDKMEQRYEWLSRARVRNIAAYNELDRAEIERRVQPQGPEECQAMPVFFPYIVIIIDEVGDLIMSMKKEVESHIIRLAQKSRAAGIHVILATQKPTVDVITGLIKSNMPARICFQVASRADSMVVLDEKGADKLLGQGDMLFLQPSSSTIIRAQGAYVDDKEIERTVSHLELDEPNYDTELLNIKASEPGGGNMGEKLRERDPLYEQAVEVVIREQRGSTSLLQRALGIGYGKASRFIDFMAEDGIVGPYNGSNARQVLLKPEEWDVRRQQAG